jgi:hypothetical protein
MTEYQVGDRVRHIFSEQVGKVDRISDCVYWIEFEGRDPTPMSASVLELAGEPQPKKPGRPRRYAGKNDRQKAWKKRTGFEQTPERLEYKAEKAREYRARKKRQGES